jgi:hypothetical protein
VSARWWWRKTSVGNFSARPGGVGAPGEPAASRGYHQDAGQTKCAPAWRRRTRTGRSERAALEAGRTLLVLDTASAEAERLYERGGWQRVGTVPKYALMPNGTFCSTVIYYKDLST